ncbi:MAG: DUF368 domain-containing protein [Nitriliruptor sp.]|uniref:DUF368 domain-containing protein n=1 Tax=Nitriliruptor sp. TaxID=2448056 RepID=UPI0034A02195
MTEPSHVDPSRDPDEDDIVATRPPEADRRATPFLPLDVLGTYVVGFAMGTADIVPGFSGGTVALVAGVYERLVANVRQAARAASLLVRGQLREAIRALGVIEWVFVVALLSGVFSAIVALASFLEQQLEDEPVLMSAIFLGLVLGATVVATGELRAPSVRHAVIAVAVAAVTFVALGARAATSADPALWLLFIGGAIAICALILPGISGSFLLLLFGVYEFVIASVSNFDVTVLTVVAAGAVVGLASFSTLLNWLLREHHDVVLAALLGLMAGSARVLWPWPSTDGVGDPSLGPPVGSEVPLAIAVMVGGVVAVVTFAFVARRVADAT